MPPSASRYGPLSTWLQPGEWVLLLCATCVNWTLIVLAGEAIPGWIVAPLPLLSFAVTAESMLSAAYLRRHRLSRERRTRFRLQEILALLVGGVLSLTLVRLVAEGTRGAARLVQALAGNPLALVDRTAIVWCILLVAAWVLPLFPQDQLALMSPQVGELGPAPASAGYDEWLHSPARHYDHLAPFRRLIGVCTATFALEIISAGVAWYGAPWDWRGVTAVVLSFVCGFGCFQVVALAHYLLRSTRWQADRVKSRVSSPAEWVPLSGLLVGAVMLCAVIVPAAILVVLARVILDGVLLLGLLLMSLLAIPIPKAISSRVTPPSLPLFPRATPPPAQPQTTAAPWIPPTWLGSALVGLVLLVAIVFLLVRGRGAIRGKGGLWRQVFAAFVVLLRDVRAAIRWLARRARMAAAQLAAAVNRQRAATLHRASKTGRPAVWSERQVVRRLFQALIREGGKAGIRRQPGDTARDFASRIVDQLPAEVDRIEDLAATYEVASYSQLVVSEHDVTRARSRFSVIRHAIRDWARRRREEANVPR